MTSNRPYSAALERLRGAGLRPTRQRLALTKLLYSDGDRHVTAESLHKEAMAERVRVSLATVYNTLHQFTPAGLLREVIVDSTRSYFDTNTSHHHHFFCEESQRLMDIPGDAMRVENLPPPPSGTAVKRIDVVVRVRPTDL
ncbi:MAG: transcriptional repressor [Proteobacteria bacterium]|nr:transcriptional repressor [Pseudomonadota bacterium]